MKYLSIFFPFLVGCADYHGVTYASNGNKTGEYRSRTLMTDLNAGQFAPGMTTVVKQNQSRVPLQLIRSGERVIGYGIAARTTELLSDNSTREVLGAQDVTKAANAGREATKQLQITEPTRQLGLTKEPPVILP